MWKGERLGLRPNFIPLDVGYAQVGVRWLLIICQTIILWLVKKLTLYNESCINFYDPRNPTSLIFVLLAGSSGAIIFYVIQRIYDELWTRWKCGVFTRSQVIIFIAVSFALLRRQHVERERKPYGAKTVRHYEWHALQTRLWKRRKGKKMEIMTQGKSVHWEITIFFSIIARFGLSSWRVIVKTFGDESRNKQCYSRPYLSRIFTMTYTISQSLTSMELCAELEVIFRNSAHSSQGDL